MYVVTNCEHCGRRLKALEKHAGRRVNCPDCGRPNELPHVQENAGDPFDDDPLRPMPVRQFVDAPSPAVGREQRTAEADGSALERLFRQLLDPRSIQWMLITGGGLMVVGIVVWLVSLGVFDDPRIVAVGLCTGALAVVGVGGWLATRTKHRVAGDAVAFLGCVLLPLNIWFLHTQSLLALGHLWIGGVLCCGVFVLVLWLLRSPLFVYAIEAGVTLTVILLLYDLGHVSELHTLAVTFLGLGLVSIHLERAFPPEGTFDRGRYGLAVFWCGHVQLAAALLVLIGTQLAEWVVWPLFDYTSPLPILAEKHLLTIGVYLAATYAYLYSDLVVRRLAVYTSLAGATFALALLTFVFDAGVPLEGIALVLALLAIGVHVARGTALASNERFERAAIPMSCVLGALPVLMGFVLHVRATSPTLVAWNWEYEPTWLYVVAMLVTAVAGHLGARADHEDGRMVQLHFLLGGAGTLLGAAGLLRLMGVVGWPGQAVCLVPIAGLYLAGARLQRGRVYEWPLYWTAHAATAAVMLSLLVSTQSDVRHLVAVRGSVTNLLIAAVFAEALAFYLAAGFVWKRGRNTYFAAVAACGIVWQLLAYVELVGQVYFAVFAAIGIAFLIAGRMLGVETKQVYDEYDQPRTAMNGRGLPAVQSGIAITAVALVAAGLHGLNVLVGDTVEWGQVWGLLPVIVAGAVAAVMTPSGGWRRFFVTATLGLLGVFGLTLNFLIDLGGWEKLQLFTLVIGLGLLAHAHAMLLREKEGTKDPDIGFGTTMGSLLAVVPIGIAAIHGQLTAGTPNWQAFTLLTLTILMIVAGTTLRVRATTIVGGGTLGLYLLTVIGSLAYHPQTPVGVYLAAGGILVFAAGIVLSIYRDRLVELPKRIANREGVFAILKWR